MRPSMPSARRGFTLIELMVAVVVAGILAAVAYPALSSFVQRSRRADAMALLATVVQAQERHRSNRSEYASQIGPDNGLMLDETKLSKHYGLSLTGVGSPVGFAAGYQVTATPRSNSPQALDSTCATLSIRMEGAKFSYLSTDSSDADSSARCWAK